jgi:hypothetical protein
MAEGRMFFFEKRTKKLLDFGVRGPVEAFGSFF